jgi:glycosyltransferase involved in cell wall biosynthesis
MQEYDRKYPNFHALHSEKNHHQGGAKNIGLTRATGEWIGFIDADDWVTPDYYERLLARAKETGADMVGCDYQLTAEHSWKSGRHVPNNNSAQTGRLDYDRYKMLLLDPGSLVVKIYRREIVFGSRSLDNYSDSGTFVRDDAPRLHIFPEDIFYEDNAVANTWMLRAEHFEYIPEPMYYYYQHEESTVHTISRRNLEDRKTAGRLLLMEAMKQGYLETYRQETEFKYTVLFYINTLFSAMPSEQHLKGCYRFTKDLAAEMKRTFPRFESNLYYQKRISPEEKKLIRLQMRSQLLFFCYYRLLWFYRKLRKRLGG